MGGDTQLLVKRFVDLGWWVGWLMVSRFLMVDNCWLNEILVLVDVRTDTGFFLVSSWS